MQYSTVNPTTRLLRFDPNDNILLALTNFCKKTAIDNAYFSGIGSVENPTLAHYRMDTKKYSEKKLKGIFEITSIIGNVSLFENKPLVHAHVALGDKHMQAFAGHLVQGVVSATLEIVLNDLKSREIKLFNNEIGLKLWSFS